MNKLKIFIEKDNKKIFVTNTSVFYAIGKIFSLYVVLHVMINILKMNVEYSGVSLLFGLFVTEIILCNGDFITRFKSAVELSIHYIIFILVLIVLNIISYELLKFGGIIL